MHKQFIFKKDDGNWKATVWIKKFSDDAENEHERKRMIEKIALCSQFGMRYQGLVRFYGNDLIGYQEKIGANKNGTEFLRVLANHFANTDDEMPPSSWQDCNHQFWEELIFSYFPHIMKISKSQNQSVRFLFQLKKFVRWLDKQKETTFSQMVEQLVQEAMIELVPCEHMLNELFTIEYPTIHSNDWDFKKEINVAQKKLESAVALYNSVFQVLKIQKGIVDLKDLDKKRTYQVTLLPCARIKEGVLLNGMIGKQKGDFYWEWMITEGVYPNKAKQYIQFVDE